MIPGCGSLDIQMALMDFNIIIMLMGRQHWETKSHFTYLLGLIIVCRSMHSASCPFDANFSNLHRLIPFITLLNHLFFYSSVFILLLFTTYVAVHLQNGR